MCKRAGQKSDLCSRVRLPQSSLICKPSFVKTFYHAKSEVDASEQEQILDWSMLC